MNLYLGISMQDCDGFSTYFFMRYSCYYYIF